MKSNSIWQRVSKRRPCPVCDKPDWCMYVGPEDSPTAAICARTESAKRCGEGGWLHVLRNDGPTWAPWRRSIQVAVRKMNAATATDFTDLTTAAWAAAPPMAVERLAGSLGVSVSSLNRLDIGWLGNRRAWCFPMRDADGKVLGVRLRYPNNRKLSVKGGKEGLFIPVGIDTHGLLLIAEGPTDTAALLDLGFSVVGRPSCTGGVKLLVELVRTLKPSGVVIVADTDAPGQRGAETLAAVLVAYAASVRIIAPPLGVKDAREWRRSGATAADVRQAIDAAPIHKLTVRVQRRTRREAHHGR
ncbi:MAG: toprim domain-containing protein [Thermoguttaceae bacterium]